MPEKLIVMHCAPTLAGLKTANLFTCDIENTQTLLRETAEFNRRFQGSGVRMIVLGYPRGKALVYVFRIRSLIADLKNEKIQSILREKGYEPDNVSSCLRRLICRIREKNTEFPHEIGCFLGYPADDIRGFMENREASYCHGVWRVYSNVEEAKRLFAEYRSCTAAYLNSYSHGMSLERLAVNLQG